MACPASFICRLRKGLYRRARKGGLPPLLTVSVVIKIEVLRLGRSRCRTTAILPKTTTPLTTTTLR